MEGWRESDLAMGKSMKGVAAPPPAADSEEEHPAVKQVVDLVMKDDRVGAVGIWGMGGVGKTYVMQQIKNHPSIAASGFDLVLWWPFTYPVNPPDTEALQSELADLLALTLPPNSCYWRTAIHDFLSPKKFLLLLDGLWAQIDLHSLGIPHVQNHGLQVNPNHKLIFTTRLNWTYIGICPAAVITVHCLEWEDSWLLFRRTFGDQLLRSDPFLCSRAVQVAERCAGLPLALIAAARAMSAIDWEHLMFMPPRPNLIQICGHNNRLFTTLKHSYTSLPTHQMKQCFLLSSLWPDGFPIPRIQLVLSFLAHGLIHNCTSESLALAYGESIISKLARDGLVDPARVNIHGLVHVRMHSVVRELARSIASQEKNWMVSSGLGLDEAPHQPHMWKEAETVSLMYNNIKHLPLHPDCPNLSTLMLQHNYGLHIPNDFFQNMPHLAFLNLSSSTDCSPSSLPASPPNLAGLLQLRYLDLSRTAIESLPEEMANLSALEYLLLSETRHLTSIPRGLILKLKNLKMLDLYASRYVLSDGAADDIWKRSQMSLWTTLGATLVTASDVQRLYEATYIGLWRLWIKDLVGLTSLNLFEIILPDIKTQPTLCELTLSSCTSLEEFIMTDESLFGKPKPNFQNVEGYIKPEAMHGCQKLEVLALLDLPKLEKITCGNWPFFMVRSLTVSTCSKLKNLTWIKELKCLEHLSIEACYAMEEVIAGSAVGDGMPIFHRLSSLCLRDLPNLEYIWSSDLVLSWLEVFRLFACPKLKRLPFSSQIAKKKFRGVQIKGTEQWWEDLVWEEDGVKSLLQPYFGS